MEGTTTILPERPSSHQASPISPAVSMIKTAPKLPLTSFPIFTSLPIELRRLIWSHACATRRIITIGRKNACHPTWLPDEKRIADARLSCYDGPVPALLQASREAREVGLLHYEIVDCRDRIMVLSQKEAGLRDAAREARRQLRRGSVEISTVPTTGTATSTSDATSKPKRKRVPRLYINFDQDVFFLPTADSLSTTLTSISAGMKSDDVAKPPLARIRRMVIGPNIFEVAAQSWRRTLMTGEVWRQRLGGAEEQDDEEEEEEDVGDGDTNNHVQENGGPQLNSEAEAKDPEVIVAERRERDRRKREELERKRERLRRRAQKICLHLQELTILKWDVSTSLARMARPRKTAETDKSQRLQEIEDLRKTMHSCYKMLMAMVCHVEVEDENGEDEEGAWMGEVKLLEGLRVNYAAGRRNIDVSLDWSWVEQYRNLHQ